ncbi:MAG TPA: hypothetical protein VFB16_01020 [Bauldia sp.]|nr:hypothetical protein [Bauldia sp.]
MSLPTDPEEKSETLPQPVDDSAGKKRASYNRLVRQARLLSLILEKVDFKMAAESLGVSRSLLTRDITGKKKILSSGATDGTCIANMSWNISIKYKRKILSGCTAIYLVAYDGMQDCAEDTIEMFLENVAKAATYPYFRALYAHLDWAANPQSAPLPILKFQPNV